MPHWSRSVTGRATGFEVAGPAPTMDLGCRCDPLLLADECRQLGSCVAFDSEGGGHSVVGGQGCTEVAVTVLPPAPPGDAGHLAPGAAAPAAADGVGAADGLDAGGASAQGTRRNASSIGTIDVSEHQPDMSMVASFLLRVIFSIVVFVQCTCEESRCWRGHRSAYNLPLKTGRLNSAPACAAGEEVPSTLRERPRSRPGRLLFRVVATAARSAKGRAIAAHLALRHSQAH